MGDEELYIEVYKVEASKYDSTRNIQWKMNISIWTVIIVGIYAKSQNQLNYPEYINIIASLVYLVIHSMFVFFIQKSLSRSLTRMERMAKHMLKDKTLTWAEIDEGLKRKNRRWEYLQIFVTAFLLLIFIFTN